MNGLELLQSILSIVIVILMAIALYIFLSQKVTQKKTVASNNTQCRKVLWQQKWTNYTDYFWSNSSRFAWITLFLVFFIAVGIVIEDNIGYAISIVFSIIFILFLIFAFQSYKNFPSKVKQKLSAFENALKAKIEDEISFEGDNIQRFSSKDNHMETESTVFDFPTNPQKVPFPPYEKNAGKHLLIGRKLEFLILSREYFSICKEAIAFHLLDPARGGIPQKCAEKNAAGECKEYYYSQMRNVVYEDNSIKIIFEHDEDTVSFTCPKGAANRKPAMKALKEKLRITERQRLAKIQEHKKFEEIEIQRKQENEKTEENTEDTNTEKNE